MDFRSRFSRNAYFTDTSVCDVADELQLTVAITVLIYNHGKKSWHTWCNSLQLPLTTEIENEASHCSIESTGSCFYHNPSPPPSINVGASGKANLTWLWWTLHWGRGVTFSPKLEKSVSTFLFHGCRPLFGIQLPWCTKVCSFFSHFE